MGKPQRKWASSPLVGRTSCIFFAFKPRIERLTPRWNVGQPFGKASWESLVGKPRGKATDPLIHTKGSSTLLLQLERKLHVHALTQDED